MHAAAKFCCLVTSVERRESHRASEEPARGRLRVSEAAGQVSRGRDVSGCPLRPASSACGAQPMCAPAPATEEAAASHEHLGRRRGEGRAGPAHTPSGHGPHRAPPRGKPADDPFTVAESSRDEGKKHLSVLRFGTLVTFIFLVTRFCSAHRSLRLGPIGDRELCAGGWEARSTTHSHLGRGPRHPAPTCP